MIDKNSHTSPRAAVVCRSGDLSTIRSKIWRPVKQDSILVWKPQSPS